MDWGSWLSGVSCGLGLGIVIGSYMVRRSVRRALDSLPSLLRPCKPSHDFASSMGSPDTCKTHGERLDEVTGRCRAITRTQSP